MTSIVKYWNLGRISYDKSYNLQKILSKLHKSNDKLITMQDIASSNISPATATHNTILLMEHEPVYTTGLRDYFTTEEETKLKSLGAQFYRTDRGGLVTFHGPGQLTAYPIINLKHFKPSVRWYVCRLEECVIETCKKMGIHAERSPHTGVWVNDKKVCALGVHVSHGITTHGLALNCSTDLKWYDYIVPCGIVGKGVTSLTKELGAETTIDDVLPVFYESFEQVFDCSLVKYPENDKKLLVDECETPQTNFQKSKPEIQ